MSHEDGVTLMAIRHPTSFDQIVKDVMKDVRCLVENANGMLAQVEALEQNCDDLMKENEQLRKAVHTRDEIINELRERLKVREINKVGDFIEMTDAGEKAMEGVVAVQGKPPVATLA